MISALLFGTGNSDPSQATSGPQQVLQHGFTALQTVLFPVASSQSIDGRACVMHALLPVLVQTALQLGEACRRELSAALWGACRYVCVLHTLQHSLLWQKCCSCRKHNISKFFWVVMCATWDAMQIAFTEAVLQERKVYLSLLQEWHNHLFCFAVFLAP